MKKMTACLSQVISLHRYVGGTVPSDHINTPPSKTWMFIRLSKIPVSSKTPIIFSPEYSCFDKHFMKYLWYLLTELRECDVSFDSRLVIMSIMTDSLSGWQVSRAASLPQEAVAWMLSYRASFSSAFSFVTQLSLLLANSLTYEPVLHFGTFFKSKSTQTSWLGSCVLRATCRSWRAHLCGVSITCYYFDESLSHGCC